MTPAAATLPGSRLPAALQTLGYGGNPVGYATRQRARHGDVWRARFLGFGEMVYAADPALVKQIFTGDPAVFHAGEATAQVLEPALGPYSVLVLDDEPHMRQRKLLLPPFHGQAVKRYEEVILDAVNLDMETWPVGRPFKLRSHTEAITLAVILRAVFGVRDAERFERARTVVREFARRSHPIVLFPFLRRNLGRFSPWARFVRAREALDEIVYEEIEARRAEIAAGSEHDDVLSLLLAARHEDGSPMTDAELRDELVTIVGAGHETTATAVAWAFERLLRTPRAQDRLTESVLSRGGSEGLTPQSGEEDYLEATIKETLRIRPVISDVARRVTVPIELGGHAIPAGTLVLAAITSLHFREDLFPDPHEFRPERWLDEERTAAYSWIPFGGGVRHCIGAAFAQYEMKLMLREMIERADLRAPDARPERMKPTNITLAPARGATVVLERPLRPRVLATPEKQSAVAAA